MNTHGLKFTTAELARELGIGKRAIYNHFISKQHLAESVLERIIADLRQQISNIASDNNLDIFARIKARMVLNPKGFGPVSTQVIEDVRRFMPQEWAKFENFFMERWRMLEQIIEEGSNKGLLAKVDLVILNKIYNGTIDQLLDWQFLAQNNITFNNAMIKAADILIGCLKAPGPKPDAAGQPRSAERGPEQERLK
jgi:AcrR family transcriptional regulator